MAQPAWRFDPEFLRHEERFGYREVLWPETIAFLGLRSGMRILDVGCGPGGFVLHLSETLGGDTEVVGLDSDAKLIADASARAARDGARVRFETGDALKLPYPDASFDAVVSSFLLCVLPEPVAALREMRRVAKPGATVGSLSCFCKSGIFPTFAGIHEFEGAQRLEELRRRFQDVRRVHVRNPALGLPNGHDLDVWADHPRAGLVEPRIRGFLTVFAPSDARWSDAQARAYVESRRRIELGMVDNLTPAQRETMAKHGFTHAELAEFRALLERKHAWLLADDARIRKGMELVCDPAVLIAAKTPTG